MIRQFQILRMSPWGDGATALYEEGKLIMSGDHYHNYIESRIEGFLEGLQHTGDIEVALEDYNNIDPDLEEEYNFKEDINDYLIGVEILDHEAFNKHCETL